MTLRDIEEAKANGELEHIVDIVRDAGQGARVSLRDVVQALGARSFAPLLLVPALAVVSPLSGILFFSTFCGLAIALIALQILLGRSTIWLPEFLLDRSVRRARVRLLIGRARYGAGKLGQFARKRWTAFAEPPLAKLPALVCMVLGLAMPFLEVVPFSSSLLGLAVTAMALGMLLRDGLFVIAGLVFAAMLVFLGTGVTLSIVQAAT